MNESDYMKYRGKCLEMSQQLVEQNPDLRLVRGHYWCPIWNKDEPHWWCEIEDDGEILVIDPTARQFPSKGCGEYTEFDPEIHMISCEECGKKMKEDDVVWAGNYPVCSTRCNLMLVGLGEFVK